MTKDQINQLWTESITVADFLIAIGVVKVDEENSVLPKSPCLIPMPTVRATAGSRPFEPSGQIGKVLQFMRNFRLTDRTPGELYNALESVGLEIRRKTKGKQEMLKEAGNHMEIGSCQ
jgi:hypothetical protein